MARFEVTGEMYLEYLNDRDWHKRCDPPCGDWGHVPRKAVDAMEQTAYWPRDTSGKFSIPADWEEWPVFAVSWNDATDYCKWLTERKGGGTWRFELPTEDEWERAARGPDGRLFPWSDAFHAAFCRMQDSRPGEQEALNPEAFGLFPIDESPLGVRDLAGGMCEWTSTVCGSRGEWRIQKGGAWSAGSALCRCAYRIILVPEYVSSLFGLRLVARRTP